MSNPDCSVLSIDHNIVKTTVGPMVLGLILQNMFFVAILLQATQYYTRFNYRDGQFYRFTVGVLIILNIFSAAMGIHVHYRTTVTHFGEYHFVDLQTWTAWAEPGLTAIIGFFVHLFFLGRCWSATNRSRTAALSLLFLVLLSLGSGLAVSVSFFEVKTFSDLATRSIPMSFWLASTAVTNIAIAVILSADFLKAFDRPASIVKKTLQLMLETSAVTALIALLNLVLYFAKKNTAYHLLAQYSLSRIATVTVLVTLLEREDPRNAAASYGSFALSGPMKERTVNKVEVKVNTIVERDHDTQDGSMTKPESTAADSKTLWPNTV
ncbi:hypothetical protein B0H19DRAFT_1098349 [Mycena capillaripes]|nr:hypothetical protein B0H19DRAFT_1098349 [Mycena capillaripes]